MYSYVVKVSKTKVLHAAGNEEEKLVYQLSDTYDQFSLSIAVAPESNHDQIESILGSIASKMYAHAQLTQQQVEDILKPHLSQIQQLEEIVVFFSAKKNQMFCYATGRFYLMREAEGTPVIVAGLKVESDGLASTFTKLMISTPAFGWVSIPKQTLMTQYAANTASELFDTNLPVRPATLENIKSDTFIAGQPIKPRSFPLKTATAAGGALSALGTIALVMTLTAKFPGSSAVIGLVGIKTMNILWPIALGVGTTLLLASLYHFGKQQGLFSCGAATDDISRKQSSMTTAFK